jgi:ring-1,2-phenylacetyl-CoA epoxidase subunit PaaE
MFNLFKKKTKEKASKGRRVSIKVLDVIRETDDATTLVFEKPTEDFQYKCGQFLTLIIPVDGQEFRRSYSLCTSPYTDALPAITVKRVEQGKVSNYLNQHMKVGDQFDVLLPAGAFTPALDTSAKRPYILFAGGSGITPLMSILKAVLSQEPDSRVLLIYQNRTESSIIFQKQLDQLSQQYSGRLVVRHVLSKPDADWSGLRGRLDGDMVRSLLVEEKDLDKAQIFLCGPSGMMHTAEEVLAELGVQKSQVFKESFVPGETDVFVENSGEKPVLEQQTVIIELYGEEHRISVKPNQSILEAGLDQGLDMPFSCQSGLCTACMGKLVAGQIHMDEDEGLTDADKAEGYILNCVGHPITADVKIKID